MPPCLLGTYCGTNRILMRVRIRNALWTVRNEDRTWDGTEDGSMRLRTRSGIESESGTITLEFLPCGASHRLVDPNFST